MAAPIRTRIERLEAGHRARAAQADHSGRRWALLNLYVRACAGLDLEPWRQDLANLPPPPTGAGPRRELGTLERQLRVLALLCREARRSSDYRELLAIAVKAGLATERQVQWIMDEGLVETTVRP